MTLTPGEVGVVDVDVAIVGGGFGGAYTARALTRLLSGSGRSVVLVSPENFLLFTPLLPEAAAGTIEPRHAVIPLRDMIRWARLLVGEVTTIDLDERTIGVRDLNGRQRDISYRALVLSPGSVPHVLDIPGLTEQAVGFKTLADAIWLRNRVLRQLEAAAATDDAALRRELLTFMFVGGGYAGVEALAELESLAHAVVRAYGHARADEMRWVLVEANDVLLPGLDQRLSRYAKRLLERRGLEVHLKTQLLDCRDGVVTLSDGTPPFRCPTLVWTAGQRPSSLVRGIGLPLDERGRVVVDDRLRVPGHDGVFALGDVAAVPAPEGGLSPATAQHALRQAAVCAANVATSFGVGTPRRFTYRNRGLTVTLGMGRGTTLVRRVAIVGPLAWWLGRSYHLLMTPGLSRKFRLVTDWTISALFRRDVAQLGSLGQPAPVADTAIDLVAEGASLNRPQRATPAASGWPLDHQPPTR